MSKSLVEVHEEDGWLGFNLERTPYLVWFNGFSVSSVQEPTKEQVFNVDTNAHGIKEEKVITDD